MKYDAIVIGAGPSGSASAYTLAKNGYKVLLIERGSEPGAKNVSGAMIRESEISKVFETKDIPFERIVKRVRLIFRSKDDESEIIVKPKSKLYTISRLKFDKWLAQRAENAGALLITKTTVTGIEGNKVMTERGSVEGDKIVIAEGANALLSMSLGFRRELKNEETVLGVKEVYASTRNEVEKRFNLQGDEGESWRIISDYPLPSAGFIYTYKDSIAIGVGARVDEIITRGIRPFELLDSFKMPYVELVKGFSLREYSAKIIPENGFPSFKPCEGSVYVTGDALGLVDPLTFDGIGPAIISGYLAGKAENCYSYSKMLFEAREISKVIKSRPLVKELLPNIGLYSHLVNDFLTSWVEGDFSKLRYYKSSLGKLMKHLILGLGVIE
ncbi:NAD(P)/FAD-dependent oxidoreductase [Sulfolobus sp. S-194]|uniref:NAD(P)/FAD-dependent oxidoreductase n=1 Tax=Sulfolobus sp. S-194 TaxID=2512240 RepID=UPI001436F197|nr:NAD(P)/FAD-dependent oxidoreductase [Sulfolobus sp. S-194]QIW24696.1 NAD(P)/FAD-dependent oxidoreductase [Sulfolobus sp. S-194]